MRHGEKILRECPECMGAGEIVYDCEFCNGEGEREVWSDSFGDSPVSCAFCNGTGKEHVRCDKCDGHGAIEDFHEPEFDIEDV